MKLTEKFTSIFPVAPPPPPPERSDDITTDAKLYDARLHKMLQYMRPHNTMMELDWADEFIGPYSPIEVGDKATMAYVVQVPRQDGTVAEVLFSAHVDTVHQKEGMQTVHFNAEKKEYYKKDGQPLGADDGAGCWLLLEMIDRKVPGTYIFHRGEECGGIGSGWMADNQDEWLATFKYAIAFDRKATHSVITHQGGTRCCSDAFGEALSNALNDACDNFMYSLDDTGSYTDTKEYVGLIPECTNVSVGYMNEHRGTERLDLEHLFALREVCCVIDWEALPAERDPKVIEDKYEYGFGVGSWGGQLGQYVSRRREFDEDDPNELAEMSLEDLQLFAFQDPDQFGELVYRYINGDNADEIVPGPQDEQPEQVPTHARGIHSMGDDMFDENGDFVGDSVDIRLRTLM